MAFIAKNPIVAPETNSPLVPPQNTRAIFPRDDGWYEIDDKGNVSKLVTDEYGKGLSTKDYTTEEKTKLSELPTKTELDTDLSGKEDTANKVTTLDSNATDTQYPSAKCVYDADNALVLADERAKYYGDKDIVPSNESYFTVNETGETITGLTDTGKMQTKLVIPYEINGVKITDLGHSDTPILNGNGVITKIVIPNSITSIRNSAFYNCSSLTSINIPNSVTRIGEGAFFNCESLTSIDIPNSITHIESGAFQGCTSLTSINIPDSVVSIQHQVFYGCTSLKSVNIPNSVTNIGDYTFHVGETTEEYPIPGLTIYCEQDSYAETYAKEKNIPIVYTDVKDMATKTELERLKYYGDKDIIPSDESYFTVNSTGETITGLTDTGKTQMELVIPYKINGVEITNLEYGNNTSILNGNGVITKIVIPNSVTRIGDDAFKDCTSLISVNIPNSVTNIGFHAFFNCTSLTSINIPSSVTSIEIGVFVGCTNLTIYCEQGSYAETYAKANNIPVVYTDVKATSINPTVKTAFEDTITVNTIYDLGVQTALTITLPSGQIGDFIQVDFISGSTATTLTVNSSSGLVGFDLIPGTNTIYTLYFDWGEMGYDGTVTYGWRFNYSEYSVDVV